MRAYALPFALVLPTVFATAMHAEIFDTAIVRGAKVVAEDDILNTCGPLTGVELDDYDFRDIETCLKSTGVFEDVKLVADNDVLTVEVVEIPTKPGRFDIGLAWNSDDAISAEFAYNQYDLIPQSYLSIDGSVSKERKTYGVGILREKAWGEALHFGFKLEGQATNYDDMPYRSDVDQVEASLIWSPTNTPLRADLGLGYRSQKLFALDPDASPIFRDSMQRISAPFLHIGLSFAQGKQDAALQSQFAFEQYVWNLGTDDRILDLRFSADLQYSIDDKSKFLVGLQSGVALPREGNQLSALDRTNMGGESLRGFAARGIGPADFGDLLGGMRYAGLSLEAQRELSVFQDKTFTGGIFLDMGSVWGLTNSDNGRVDDSFNLRSSLGLSATFHVNDTPVSLYVAKPLKKLAQDDVQYFGLMVQATF